MDKMLGENFQIMAPPQQFYQYGWGVPQPQILGFESLFGGAQDCQIDDSEKMDEYTYMRKLVAGFYQASARGFYGSDKDLISDQCMGDWMDESFSGLQGMLENVQKNPLSMVDTAGEINGIIEADAKKNVELCQVGKLQADYDHWCLGHKGVCEGNDGQFLQRVMDNGLDIMAAAVGLFNVATKDTRCMTDQQSLDEIIAAYEELVRVVFSAYDLHGKWSSNDDPEHPNVYRGYQIDYENNFIVGAHYHQYDIGFKKLTYTEALDICLKYAKEQNAYGFFYQMHPSGWQIVGLYQTEADMQGQVVKHGHPRGLIATLI